jgi:hypothetical protein
MISGRCTKTISPPDLRFFFFMLLLCRGLPVQNQGRPRREAHSKGVFCGEIQTIAWQPEVLGATAWIGVGLKEVLMEKFKQLLVSRKFWAPLPGSVLD